MAKILAAHKAKAQAVDSETFEDLIAKLFAAASRRKAVKGLFGGALASVSTISIASAKGGKRKGRDGKNRNGGNGGNDGKGKNDGNGGGNGQNRKRGSAKRKKQGNAQTRNQVQAQKKNKNKNTKRCKKNGKNCSENQSLSAL